MSAPGPHLWRPVFLAAGVLVVVGGAQHPRGALVDMLGDPAWVASHALMLAGFAALLLGLLLYLREDRPHGWARRWTRIAALATALQATEGALHTAAAVDRTNLVAGDPTPVLSAHLGLSVVIYPLFGLAMIGLIWAGARQRELGSPWIAWLGILGAAAHGLSAPLVVGLGLGRFRILFPGLLLLGAWLVLAAVWPVRAGVAAGSPRGEASA